MGLLQCNIILGLMDYFCLSTKLSWENIRQIHAHNCVSSAKNHWPARKEAFWTAWFHEQYLTPFPPWCGTWPISLIDGLQPDNTSSVRLSSSSHALISVFSNQHAVKVAAADFFLKFENSHMEVPSWILSLTSAIINAWKSPNIDMGWSDQISSTFLGPFTLTSNWRRGLNVDLQYLKIL